MLRLKWRLVALVAVPVLAVLAYSGWSAYSVAQHLRAAEASYRDLTAALSDGDIDAATEASQVMSAKAGAARDGADGRWWSAMARAPFVGDDVEGVRALTTSLDEVAHDAVPSLLQIVQDADDVQGRSGLDIQAIADLHGPLKTARQAMASARNDVSDVDSSGFTEALRPKFDAYVESVSSTTDGLDSAATAVDVLPAMLGGKGTRRYLFVFQNNAEIRATGGMPGNFLEVTATDGRIDIASGRDARVYFERRPPLPITAAERAVYDAQLGSYFQDANFTPDFPRAADLWRMRWEEANAGRRLDGVLAIDPVALSYLLAGTGPVKVDGVVLKPSTAVAELLRDPYIELSTFEQDEFFAKASREIFAAATTQIKDPMAFARALGRSASEGRLLVHSFAAPEQRRWADDRIAGALSGDDGRTPHVDIGLNDGTGSKMSYYLRSRSQVRATRCFDAEQHLSGTLTLNQAISPKQAAGLPVSVTGGGAYGTTPGEQLVFVRVYGPFGGTVSRIRVDDELIELTDSVDLDGRPVSTVAVSISTTRDVVVSWDMTTGPGQTGAGELGMTPSVTSGSSGSTFASACGS